ncbi:uncharacterized protein [Watersipora subatra]|uniref:uncharacterized protein n=1 Tax=Watersipora subatra TaxID=2589382 RepID=UPI00355AE3D7
MPLIVSLSTIILPEGTNYSETTELTTTVEETSISLSPTSSSSSSIPLVATYPTTSGITLQQYKNGKTIKATIGCVVGFLLLGGLVAVILRLRKKKLRANGEELQTKSSPLYENLSKKRHNYENCALPGQKEMVTRKKASITDPESLEGYDIIDNPGSRKEASASVYYSPVPSNSSERAPANVYCNSAVSETSARTFSTHYSSVPSVQNMDPKSSYISLGVASGDEDQAHKYAKLDVPSYVRDSDYANEVFK